MSLLLVETVQIRKLFNLFEGNLAIPMLRSLNVLVGLRSSLTLRVGKADYY